jgi:nitrogen fixation/metabolism regulation signal transduction histidine kinase
LTCFPDVCYDLQYALITVYKGENVSDVIDATLKLAEESLAEKQAELEEKAGPLNAEIKSLESFLKKNKKGSSTTSGKPAVEDKDLLEAVAHLSKNGPTKTTDIAKFLGVSGQQIARKLSKHASEGTISGDKDSGYTV